MQGLCGFRCRFCFRHRAMKEKQGAVLRVLWYNSGMDLNIADITEMMTADSSDKTEDRGI